MNLSKHIQRLEPVAKEKLVRLSEEVSFFARSIYEDRFNITNCNDNDELSKEFYDLQHIDTLGLTIEVSYEGRHAFEFSRVDVDDFILTMARALPDDFTKLDIIRYLSELDEGELV